MSKIAKEHSAWRWVGGRARNRRAGCLLIVELSTNLLSGGTAAIAGLVVAGMFSAGVVCFLNS